MVPKENVRGCKEGDYKCHTRKTSRGDRMNSINDYFRFGMLTQGVILIGMGIYFVFLRPVLLPEDLNYMNTSEVEINDHLPGLTHWLQKVFIVLGGYIATSGSLMLYFGIAKGYQKNILLFIFIFISGLTSIVMMAAINFIIDSDFKWLLLLFTTPWIFSIMTYFRPFSTKISK
jgi:hypothetical protein